MSEPAKNKAMVVQLAADELAAIVQEAVKSAMRSAPKDDKLLTKEQVCEILNVKDDWLYHNIRRLPFVRKIGGQLRFSSNGLQRYIEAAKFKVEGG